MGIPGYAEHWTERRPASLDMDADEVLDWLSENCSHYYYVEATAECSAGFVLICHFITDTRAPTLRQAVCLAAAKLNEAN